jgi:hypothetical protein
VKNREFETWSDVEREQYERYMQEQRGCGSVSLMCAVLTVGMILAAVLPAVVR